MESESITSERPPPFPKLGAGLVCAVAFVTSAFQVFTSPYGHSPQEDQLLQAMTILTLVLLVAVIVHHLFKGGPGIRVVTLPAVCLGAFFAGMFCMIPVVGSRGGGNETAAIGGLKTLATAQARFKEMDADGDTVLDYATLGELANPTGEAKPTGRYGSYKGALVDDLLGSGTKNGYVFECSYSATSGGLLWFATARPALPYTTGSRSFVTNQEGVVYYSIDPFELNTTDCTIPAGLSKVGR